MRKILALLAILASLLPACALGEYWDTSVPRLSRCCERPGCLVLRTVMMGTFDVFDEDDSLTVRVYSAALDRLTDVTEDDMVHFCESYDVDPDTLWDCYTIALRNCLRADILLMPTEDDEDAQLARTVLMLFLEPDDSAQAQAQKAAIRANMSDREIAIIAEGANLPYSFVLGLMEDDE